jgi:hypothetical protein
VLEDVEIDGFGHGLLELAGLHGVHLLEVCPGLEQVLKKMMICERGRNSKRIKKVSVVRLGTLR